MNELALFAGAGGGILGGHLLGWRCVCAVERDAYARDVLVARQNDGHLPPFPIWDDVCTFDGRPWRGVVDVVSGGFPCQDISAAGRGAGITGERSGLWREMARIIGEVRPRFVLVENSPMLVGRGLAVVLGDLAEMGFDARWGVLGAVDAGAPHRRERIWIVANADSEGKLQPQRLEQQERRRLSDSGQNVANSTNNWAGWRKQQSKGCKSEGHVANSDSSGLEKRQGEPKDDGKKQQAIDRAGWWELEPELGRVAHGVANRVDRLRAIGNGQVPAVVRLAWDELIN